MVADEDDVTVNQILDHITTTTGLVSNSLKMLTDLIEAFKELDEHHETYHPECRFIQDWLEE